MGDPKGLHWGAWVTPECCIEVLRDMGGPKGLCWGSLGPGSPQGAALGCSGQWVTLRCCVGVHENMGDPKGLHWSAEGFG